MMHVDGVYLRERMRLLSIQDLQRIASNDGSEYTAAAVEAAQLELACRPSTDALGCGVVGYDGITSGSEDNSLRSRLPVGVWYVFCLATVFSVVVSLQILVGVGISIAVGTTFRQIATALPPSIVVVALALWVAVAIRAEHSYVRVLLLSLISAVALYEVASIVIAWQIRREDLMALSILVAIFGYFAFNKRVGSYYRDRRHVGWS